jgi:SAM-dependent methyltransferase
VADVSLSPKLQENYDSYYSGISEWRWLGAIDKVENIIRLCRAIPHKTILEIGSGEGSILQRLSELNFGDALYSVEISQSAVETILNRGIPNVKQCQLYDGYDIPYEDARFDLAVLTHVLEHVEYPRRLLYEAARVAKFVFVEVPLEDTIRLKDDFVFDRVGHINFYSMKTIRRLIQTCGLVVLSQQVTNPSRAVYQFSAKARGAAKHLLKGALLTVSIRMASRVFTYHCSIVCASEVRKSQC